MHININTTSKFSNRVFACGCTCLSTHLSQIHNVRLLSLFMRYCLVKHIKPIWCILVMKLSTCLWKFIHSYHDKVYKELKGDFMHQSLLVCSYDILKHAHTHFSVSNWLSVVVLCTPCFIVKCVRYSMCVNYISCKIMCYIFMHVCRILYGVHIRLWERLAHKMFVAHSCGVRRYHEKYPARMWLWIPICALY